MLSNMFGIIKRVLESITNKTDICASLAFYMLEKLLNHDLML